MPAPANATPPPTPSADRVHLRFLDGFRGFAALAVLISHIDYQIDQWVADGHHRLASLYVLGTGWMAHFGRDAVAVFIVLSGFSLMLPLAASGSERLRGGPRSYFVRRAWRILPAYYATCVIAAASTFLSHRVKSRLGIVDPTDSWAQNLTPGSLISHLFLVHDLSATWVYTIEPALWSVAVEWQIYFFFPFFLLPIWRRWGLVAALGAAFVLGSLPHFVLAPEANFDWAAPWFLGLFCLGMSGALIAFAPRLRRIRDTLPWGPVALGLTLVTYVIVGRLLHQREDQYVMDLGIGLSATSLLVYLSTLAVAAKRFAWSLRPFTASVSVWLGSFSYSLYLVHGIVITRLKTFLELRTTSETAFLVAMWTLGIAASLAFAFAFHFLFERPFLTSSRKQRFATDRPASSSAA